VAGYEFAPKWSMLGHAGVAYARLSGMGDKDSF